MAPCFSSLAASARGSLLRPPLSRQRLPLPPQGVSRVPTTPPPVRLPAPQTHSPAPRGQAGQGQLQLPLRGASSTGREGASGGSPWTACASTSSVSAPGSQSQEETQEKEKEAGEEGDQEAGWCEAQTTIGREVRVAGVGLHSGLQFQATLRPAPAGHGRVFYLPAQLAPEEGTTETAQPLYIAVRATVENAVESRLCTVLRAPPTPPLGTRRAVDAGVSERASHNGGSGGARDTGPLEGARDVGATRGEAQASQAQPGTEQTHRDAQGAHEPAQPSAPAVHPGAPGAHHSGSRQGRHVAGGAAGAGASEGAAAAGGEGRAAGEGASGGAEGAGRGASSAGEVRTAEHLLSALEGLGVGNVEVQVDCLETRQGGPAAAWHELPLLDGSAAPWAEILITQAGIVAAPQTAQLAGSQTISQAESQVESQATPQAEPWVGSVARTEPGSNIYMHSEHGTHSESATHLADGARLEEGTQRRRRARLPAVTDSARRDAWGRALAALTGLGKDPANSTVPGSDTVQSRGVNGGSDTHQGQAPEDSGAARCREAVRALAEAAVVSVVEQDSLVAAFPSQVPILACGIHFPQLPVVGTQWVQWSPYATPQMERHSCPQVDVLAPHYSSSIAPARTFAIAEQVAQLQAAGLIRGGSLDNALVCSQAGGWLNPPLRFPDEPCRHKLLDLIGDLSLLARPGHDGLPCAHIVAYKASHALHCRFASLLKSHLV